MYYGHIDACAGKLLSQRICKCRYGMHSRWVSAEVRECFSTHNWGHIHNMTGALIFHYRQNFLSYVDGSIIIDFHHLFYIFDETLGLYPAYIRASCIIKHNVYPPIFCQHFVYHCTHLFWRGDICRSYQNIFINFSYFIRNSIEFFHWAGDQNNFGTLLCKFERRSPAYAAWSTRYYYNLILKLMILTHKRPPY